MYSYNRMNLCVIAFGHLQNMSAVIIYHLLQFCIFVINVEKELQKARLLLVELIQKIIKDEMGLLGIECSEKM